MLHVANHGHMTHCWADPLVMYQIDWPFNGIDKTAFSPYVHTTSNITNQSHTHFFMVADMLAGFPCLPFVSEEKLSAAEFLDDITHQQPITWHCICPTCHNTTINISFNNLLAQICQTSVTQPCLLVRGSFLCASVSTFIPISLISCQSFV